MIHSVVSFCSLSSPSSLTTALHPFSFLLPALICAFLREEEQGELLWEAEHLESRNQPAGIPLAPACPQSMLQSDDLFFLPGSSLPFETGEYLGAFPWPTFWKGAYTWTSSFSSQIRWERGWFFQEWCSSFCKFYEIMWKLLLSVACYFELSHYFAFSILWLRCPGSQMSELNSREVSTKQLTPVPG